MYGRQPITVSLSHQCFSLSLPSERSGESRCGYGSAAAHLFSECFTCFPSRRQEAPGWEALRPDSEPSQALSQSALTSEGPLGETVWGFRGARVCQALGKTHTSVSMWLSPTCASKPPAGSLRVDSSPPACPSGLRVSRTQAAEPGQGSLGPAGLRHPASQWEHQASGWLLLVSHPPIHIHPPRMEQQAGRQRDSQKMKSAADRKVRQHQERAALAAHRPRSLGADRKPLEPAPELCRRVAGGDVSMTTGQRAVPSDLQADLIAQARGSPSWGRIPC